MRNFTEVYYAKVSDISIEKWSKFLPKIRLEKLEKYSNVKDKKLSLAAYVLLKKVLKRHFINASKYEFVYLENGKPILKGCPIQFSMSHSGDFVAVAISNNIVGVDIQEMKEIDQDLRKFVFNEEDEFFYQEAENKLDAFYSLWTIKEAVYKFDGAPFKNVRIKDAASITVEGNYKLAFISISGNYKIKKLTFKKEP